MEVVYHDKNVFVGVLTSNIIAFTLAVILTRGLKATNLFRTVYFMPCLVGGIVLGYIFQLLLNGILIPMVGVDLTFDAKYGFWGLVILYNWQKDGYLMIIYIAGILSIPSELNEAARIDGASFWQSLKSITLPLVMPSITICTFLSIKDTFKMYNENLSLTGGLPGNKTAMVAMDIYNTFYNRPGFAGVGQAKAVIYTVILLMVVLIQLRITRSREVDA